MESVLKTIARRSNDLNLKSLVDHTHLVLDTIDTQKVSFAFKGWQIREKCIAILKDCLDSNDFVLRKFSLKGFETLVINPILEGVTGEEELDETDLQLFATQILDALFNVDSFNNEHRLVGLKVILRLCCDFGFAMDKDLVLKTVQMCIKSCRDQQIKSDVYCVVESLVSQVLVGGSENNHYDAAKKEFLCSAIGLASFFSQEFKDCRHSLVQCSLTLECIYTIVKTFKPTQAKEHRLLPDYIRVDLLPCLISISNSLMDNQLCRDNSSKTGRGSCLKFADRGSSDEQQQVAVKSLQHKLMLIGVQLARFSSCIASLRKHLCLLFAHLLSPLARDRFPPSYKCLQQMWASPEILFDLAGPCSGEDKKLFNLTLLLQLVVNVVMVSSIEENSDDRFMSGIICINSFYSTLLDLLHNENCLRNDQVMMFAEHIATKLLTDDNITDDDEEESDDTAVASDSGGDRWLSTEDIYSISSPCYFSALEDEEEGNSQQQSHSSGGLPVKLSELIKYVSGSTSLRRTSPSKQSNVTPNTSLNTEDKKDSASVVNENEATKEDVESLVAEHATVYSTTLNSHREAIFSQRHFDRLQQVVADLMAMNDIQEIDQTLQLSASELAFEIYNLLGGDEKLIHVSSLYALFYYIMFLTIKLKSSGHYYNARGSNLPCSKKDWVDSLRYHGVYLPSGWLRHTFDLVAGKDIFQRTTIVSYNNSQLMQFLQDMEPVNDDSLNEVCRSAASLPLSLSPACKAARSLAVKTLNVVWKPSFETWSHHIHSLLQGYSSVTVKNEECFKLSLTGLSTASRTAFKLGYLDKAKQGYELISKALFGIRGNSIDIGGFSLTSALCAETIIDGAAEITRIYPHAWKYFFRVVIGISPNHNNQTNKFDTDTVDPTLTIIKLLELHHDNFSLQDFLVTPTNSSRHVIMASQCTQEAIELLIGKVKQVFLMIFNSLNLQRLNDFLLEFLDENERVLCLAGKEKMDTSKVTSLMRCFVTCYACAARKLPLLHVSTVLRHISPLLIQASAHEVSRIAATAAACLCDVTATSLRSEPVCFRLNSWLFRSLDHSLQVGSRSQQVQNIISECVRDFVQKLPTQIRSGWTSIFALVSANQNVFLIQRPNERAIASNICESYLAIAFTEAEMLIKFATDFCQCLLKLLQNQNSNAEDIVSYLDQLHNLFISLWKFRREKVTDDVIASLPKVDNQLTRGCIWKEKESLVEHVMLKSHQTFPPSNQQVKKEVGMKKSEVKANLGLMMFQISDMIARSTFQLETEAKKSLALSDLVLELIRTQCETLGYVYTLHLILSSIFPILHSTSQLISQSEYSVKSRDKQLISNMMKFVCDVIDRAGGSDQNEETHNLIYRVWSSYLNYCIFLILTKRTTLSRLGCACLRLIMTSLGSQMTSQMMLDASDCLSYVTSQCLTSLNELMMIARVSESGKARLTLEYTESIANIEEWPPLFWKIFQTTTSNFNKPKRQRRKCFIGCKLSQNYIDLIPESSSQISLEAVVCDISSLFILLQVTSKMLFGEGLHIWSDYSNNKTDASLYLHSSGSDDLTHICSSYDTADITSSTLHSSNADVNESNGGKPRGDCMPLVAKLSPKQILELANVSGKIYATAREFNKKHSMRKIIQKAYTFHYSANLNQLACASFDSYTRMVTSLCCRARCRPPRVFPPVLHTLYCSPEGLDDDDLSWAYRLLHLAVVEIVQPWDEPEPKVFFGGKPVGELPPRHEETPEADGGGDEVIKVDQDYMAYVKQKEETSKNNGSSRTRNLKKQRAKGLFSIAKDKASSLLAKPQIKSDSSSDNDTSNKQNSCDSNSSKRSTVDKLFGFTNKSAAVINCQMLANDEKTIERETWSATVTEFLNVIMLANDDVFHRLVTVVYGPLTELVQSGRLLTSSTSCVTCAHVKLDATYRDWLVRVGKSRDIMPNGN